MLRGELAGAGAQLELDPEAMIVGSSLVDTGVR
jgi:hypothetical protein